MCLRLRIISSLILLLAVTSCSTQKNTLLTRTYHQVTARYNAYFNGRESFRAGVRRVEQQFRFDYNKTLPVFLYTDPEIARSVTPQMDRAISKASKVIANKSITAKPNERGGMFGGRDDSFMQQAEYNRWVRESYLLAGKAHFYKHDFIPAVQAFLYITRMYTMNDIRHEARVWLARSYTEMGRYNEARLVYEEIMRDPDFPQELRVEVYATMADFYLKQDRPGEALPYMERAAELERSKNTAARYTYILAQLYERTGDYQKASDHYTRVARMNPEYEMVFNAMISRAGVYRAGMGETNRMISDLQRMLRDDKNRDYLDQIYYAIGNIYLTSNDEENAIRYYSLSASARGENPSQKSISYLALGEIYFARKDYLKAHAYYDSAVMNMTTGFPERDVITDRHDILTKLAVNMQRYKLEDSVQMLAAMSESARNQVIDQIIARVREDEAEARRMEQLSAQTPQYGTARAAQAARQQAQRTGDGSWYFYNPSAVSFGENEFESLWGERRLEDNWRRSNRQVVSPDFLAMMDDDTQEMDEAGEAVPTDTRSREYYMRNIPLTEQAMNESHNRLREALFSVGMIYKDELKEYSLSAEAFSELVRRYPDSELALTSLYELHQVHMLDNNMARAEEYKQRIVNSHPETYYAAVLTNPGFFREYEQMVRAAEQYYEETFEMFRAGSYEQVIQRATYATSTWPESSLYPRFEYLRTLSYGARGNIPLFRDMLEEYASTYPGTEMAENARQFLAYLDEDYTESILMAEEPVIMDIYEGSQSGEHYFLVVVNNRQDLINRMIFNLVNFNVDNFPRLNLSVSSHSFTSGYHLLRVEGFQDTRSGIDYLNRFNASEEVYSETGVVEFPSFIISPSNYELFLKDRNVASYLSFFREEYLNRQ